MNDQFIMQDGPHQCCKPVVSRPARGRKMGAKTANAHKGIPPKTGVPILSGLEERAVTL